MGWFLIACDSNKWPWNQLQWRVEAPSSVIGTKVGIWWTIKWQFTYLKLAIQLFKAFLKLRIDFSHDGGVGRCGRCKDEVWWVYSRLATDLSLTSPMPVRPVEGTRRDSRVSWRSLNSSLGGRARDCSYWFSDQARWIKGRGAPGLFWLYHHSSQFF